MYILSILDLSWFSGAAAVRRRVMEPPGYGIQDVFIFALARLMQKLLYDFNIDLFQIDKSLSGRFFHLG